MHVLGLLRGHGGQREPHMSRECLLQVESGHKPLS
jgi:hypothetical protein